MVVFFRQIEDMDSIDAVVKKKFIDSNNEVQTLFDQTKADIRDAVSEQNIYTYSVCLMERCKDEQRIAIRLFR